MKIPVKQRLPLSPTRRSSRWKDDQAKPLFSQPVREVTISKIDQIYVTRVLWYLEHDLIVVSPRSKALRGFALPFPGERLRKPMRANQPSGHTRPPFNSPMGSCFTNMWSPRSIRHGMD